MKCALILCVLLILSHHCIVFGEKVSEYTVDPTGTLKELEPNKDASVCIVLVNWGGDIDTKTEFTLWRTATHPNIAAELTIEISSSHRAKNSGLNQVLKTIRETAEGSPIPFTHVLIMSQQTSFGMKDFETLLAADKDFISAVTMSDNYPFYPSFIPHVEAVNEIGEFNNVEQMYDLLLAQDQPFRADVVSSDMLLLKFSTLERIGKFFGGQYQWFWMSGEADWLGDCFQPNQVPPKIAKSIKPSLMEKYLSTVAPIRQNFREEDLCFCKNAHRFGYPFYIHPLVRPATKTKVYLSYDTILRIKSDLKHNSASLEGLMGTKGAVVSENRLNEYKEGRQFVFGNAKTRARVVVATAVWSEMQPSTLNRLYQLSMFADIVGRVSVDNREIQNARNELVRAVQERFDDNQYTHILFIDSDMVFSGADFEALLSLDTDIAFGLATRRSANNPPAFLPLGSDANDFSYLIQAFENQPPRPIKIKAAGMAFTLIKREVFDTVNRVNADGQKEWFWTSHLIDEDTHREYHLSEDYNFCYMAREMGYTLVLHPAAMVGHIDGYSFTILDWMDKLGIKYDVLE